MITSGRLLHKEENTLKKETENMTDGKQSGSKEDDDHRKKSLIRNKSNTPNSRNIIVLCVCLVFFSTLVVLGSVFYYRRQILKSTQLIEHFENEHFDKHYVMITSDSGSLLWQNVYYGAKSRAAFYGAYLELMGENLDLSYSKPELLKIAIESQVDGIVLEAGDEEWMTALIDEATDAGIPVVTVLNDAPASSRISFVGISSYDAGHAYGNCICGILERKADEKKTYRIIVLMDEDNHDASQNLVYSGIQETVNNEYKGGAEVEIQTSLISKGTAFAAEEVVRDIFLSVDNLPDIVVCLDEMYTTCAYQAAIDYNKVGKISILGYYQSDTIISAIEGNVIDATLAVDAKQMGEDCIDAITEYNRTGYVSDYILVDSMLLSADNLEAFQGGEWDEAQTTVLQPDDTE